MTILLDNLLSMININTSQVPCMISKKDGMISQIVKYHQNKIQFKIIKFKRYNNYYLDEIVETPTSRVYIKSIYTINNQEN